MKVRSIRVSRFRCLRACEIKFGTLTALVGPNGAGKSSILKALELFYATTLKVTREDFFQEMPSSPIEIEVTFDDLSDGAQERLAAYVDQGTLTVKRVVQWEDGKVTGNHFGFRRQIPAFQGVLRAGPAAEAKAMYETLRGEDRFKNLPQWTNRQAVTNSMVEFELDHDDYCERMIDDGQFFGFSNVSPGNLSRLTRFLLIPAVQDASVDGAEGRGTPITELMELVVRDALRHKAELAELKKHTESEFAKLLEPAALPELHGLEAELDAAIRTFAPGTGVAVGWTDAVTIVIPMPTANVRLTEGGFSASIGRTGHGVQRAFLLVLLQRLAEVRAAAAADTDAGGIESPGLLLAIEEPEIYQHPSRQRHLAAVFGRLSDAIEGGASDRMQVVYCTHSPLFVGLDRFDAVRRITKPKAAGDEPSASSVASFGLDDLAAALWIAAGQPEPRFTAASVRPRLQAILTPWMNEGFFARLVVLVEGEDDRAVLLACAAKRGVDLDALGISVIPAMGKTSLDRPLCIFRGLGIPTYVVWDGDASAKPGEQHPEANRVLLHHLGVAVEDFPSGVEEDYACFRNSLETTLIADLGGSLFDDLLTTLQAETGTRRKKHALKNPWILREVLTRAATAGATAATLDDVLDKILSLHAQSS